MKAQILSELEDLWDVVEQEIWSTAVQPTNMQQLCNTIMSIWNELSEVYLHYTPAPSPSKLCLEQREND